MAKSAYIGDTTGIAKKIKKMYVGDANGVARKVKKAYVGDANGVARLFYSGNIPFRWIYVGSSIFPANWWILEENSVYQKTFQLKSLSGANMKLARFKGYYYLIAGNSDSTSSYNHIYRSTDLSTWTLVYTIPAQSGYEYCAQYGCLFTSDDGEYLLGNFSALMNKARIWTTNGTSWSAYSNLTSSSAAQTTVICGASYVMSSGCPHKSPASLYYAPLSSFMSQQTSISTYLWDAGSSGTADYLISHTYYYNGCVYFVEFRFRYGTSSVSEVYLHEIRLSTKAHRQLAINHSASKEDATQANIYCEEDYLYIVCSFACKIKISSLSLEKTVSVGNTNPPRMYKLAIVNDRIWKAGYQSTAWGYSYYINKNDLAVTEVTNSLKASTTYYDAVALPME